VDSLHWWIALAGFATSALSGVAGLGGGTILIGVLYSLGLDPMTVVPLFAAVQVVSNASRTVAYFKHVEWHAAGWFLLACVPASFLVAPLVARADADIVRLVLALLILVSLLPARDGGNPLSARTSYVFAGLLNGAPGMFLGATGLFVGRLFLRPEWKKETVIGTLALTQTLGHLLRVAAYGVVGFTVFTQLDLLLPLVISVILGTTAGRLLNRRVSEQSFRGVFKLILAVLSLKLAWDAATGLGWIG
jgi:uncharacterized membrane protein YfcA